MTDEERKELMRNLELAKKQIDELRNKLNQLNNEKEGWFKKKEEFGSQISSLIGSLSSNKKERNKFTNEVKELKIKRKELHDLIKTKISEVKKFNEQKSETAKKYGITSDPSNLIKEIQALEFKFETEGLTFDKEQKLMKIIKEKKKKLNEAKKISDVWEKTGKISKEIDDLKREADAIHKKIQSEAGHSQQKHEQLIGSSKEIDELRAKEQEAFNKFVEAKKNFSEINDKMQETLIQVIQLKQKLGLEEEKRRPQREKQKVSHQSESSKLIENGEKIVNEKLKNKKKLTTQDLLLFQAATK